MKNIYLYSLTLLLGVILNAQVPSNYYDNANGLTAYPLKSALKNIITNGHNAVSYTELWTVYATSDRDTYYENDNSILDIYSENPTGTDSYNYTYSTDECGDYSGEGSCYNREHLVPQSVFSSGTPMRSDAHFVIPTDGYLNGIRGSLPFGIVGNSANYTSDNGSKRGINTFGIYQGEVFEPIDEFKGDIARALFYFATRYETQVDSWNWSMFNGTEDQVFKDWSLQLLLSWHTNDPVSQREIDRNNAVYNAQGNANPFINHPEYVQQIWETALDTENPTDPTNLTTTAKTTNSITISWSTSTDNVVVSKYQLYLDGILIGDTTSLSYSFTGLTADTSYVLGVQAVDTSLNTSQIVTLTDTTLNQSASQSDLIFSQYIEGSGQNKALEIANTAQNTISLEDYEIRIRYNSNADWNTPGYSLTGTLASLETITIVNQNADLVGLASMSDYIYTTNSIVSFNGNDDLGIFKNGVLIDMMGYDGIADNYAKDVTMLRNYITYPNPVFTPSEWTILAKNTLDDLGQYSSLGVLDFNREESVKIYPNPTTEVFSVNEQFENLCIYDALGKKVFVLNTYQERIHIKHLPKGFYTVVISYNNKLKYSKLIIQ